MTKIVPVETLLEGDTIKVTGAHKDAALTLTGTVHRILAEGQVRTLYTEEGVELARYVIGKRCVLQVELIRAAAQPHSVLEVFDVYHTA